jgi:acetoin utilization deacetylase AcuC-like enzyme
VCVGAVQEAPGGRSRALLKDFGPDLLIVCAGFDAIHSDETAEVSLPVQDYGTLGLQD